MQKDESAPLSHVVHKMNSAWVRGLSLRAETKTLSEKHMGVNLHDLGFGSIFLDMTLKAQATK